MTDVAAASRVTYTDSESCRAATHNILFPITIDFLVNLQLVVVLLQKYTEMESKSVGQTASER